MKNYKSLFYFLQSLFWEVTNKASAENDETFITVLNENLNHRISGVRSWSVFKEKIIQGDIRLNLFYNSDHLRAYAQKIWSGNNLLLLLRGLILLSLFSIFMYKKEYKLLSLFGITLLSSILMSVFSRNRSTVVVLLIPFLFAVSYTTHIYWPYLLGIFTSCYFACLVHNRYDIGMTHVAIRNQYYFFELFGKRIIQSFYFKHMKERYTFTPTESDATDNESKKQEEAVEKRKKQRGISIL